MSSPHDSLFKIAFGDPVHVASLLRTLLPEDLVKRIAWSTLRTVPISFVDEDLAQRYADLLFSAHIDGHPALLYFLVEHQSTTDPWMPLRLLDYCVRAWNDWRRKHPKAKHLPVIVPMVLHHSQRGWAAGTQFSDLFGLSHHAKNALEPYLVDFRFLLDDLSQQSDEQLQARAMTELGQVVLLAFKSLSYTDDPLAVMERLVPLLRKVMQAPSGLAALSAVLRYALLVTAVEMEDLQELVAIHLGPSAEDTMITTGEKLIQEGILKGEARGRAEGRAAALLKQLHLKFGQLPEATVARVQSASIAELDRWVERILSATSLEDTLR